MTARSIAIVMVCFCAVLAALGQLCFKLAANQSTGPLLYYLINPKIILGVALYGTSAIIYIVALKKGNLSTLYPFIATSYVWVSILSVFVLQEPFGVSKTVGLLLVLSGLYLIAP